MAFLRFGGCLVWKDRAEKASRVIGRIDELLAMALERVAGDRALRETLSLGGRARGALFSWDRAADQTHALYQEAVR